MAEASEKKGAPVALICGLVLIAGVAAFFSLRGTKEEGQLDTPESAVPYICLDCGNQFPVTPADYDRLAKENRVKGSGGGMDAAGVTMLPCPKCQKTTAVMAHKCEKDQVWFPGRMGNGKPGKCPKCGYAVFAR